MVMNICSQQHSANVIISTEPVVVHYNNLKSDTVYVSLLKIELERLIEDCNKSVSFHAALPFDYPPPLIDQIYFHIGICRMYKTELTN